LCSHREALGSWMTIFPKKLSSSTAGHIPLAYWRVNVRRKGNE